MTIPEIERHLTEACDKKISEGKKIIDDAYISFSGNCCPIGALTAMRGVAALFAAAATLGCTLLDVYDFVNGFDSVSCAQYHNKEFYELGQRLRAKYINPPTP